MALNVDRSKAGSLVLEKRPIPRRTDGGNVQLMEARLMELYTSLRALDRSNQQLGEALSRNDDDTDFLEALEENYGAMRNQRELAMELVTDMKHQGVNIDLPDDIREMSIPDKEKEQVEAVPETETDTGIYL